jgi:hypothetical protein
MYEGAVSIILPREPTCLMLALFHGEQFLKHTSSARLQNFCRYGSMNSANGGLLVKGFGMLCYNKHNTCIAIIRTTHVLLQ